MVFIYGYIEPILCLDQESNTQEPVSDHNINREDFRTLNVILCLH
jgi:hypothetical protein